MVFVFVIYFDLWSIPFDGSHNVEVVLGENEFDTPGS